MTEQEWLAATDPTPMMGFVRGEATDRKLRLLAVAACRRAIKLIEDKRSLNGIEVAELFADGYASETQLEKALTEAFHASYEAEGVVGEKDASAKYHLADAVRSVTQPPTYVPPEEGGRVIPYDGWESLVMIARAMAYLDPKSAIPRCPYPEGDLTFSDGHIFTEDLSLSEQTAQSELVRDIFGNPFRPVSLDPSWLTTTVVMLARQMYESRDFSTMPILADALQDAGCENDDVLDHCRGPGPHVRGCWAVDSLLGKE